MNSCEHFMASDVEWDPTGRYVTTSVSWWGHKVSLFFMHLHTALEIVANIRSCLFHTLYL